MPKMNNCNGKIPVRLIKKYRIQLWDENTLAIETGVSAKDILLIEEYKKEIMDALKARQKAEQASASEFQDKIDAIPCLKEVESALEDVATWSYIRRDETPPEYDLQSMQVKYPRAFAYLKSREYERSANPAFRMRIILSLSSSVMRDMAFSSDSSILSLKTFFSTSVRPSR